MNKKLYFTTVGTLLAAAAAIAPVAAPAHATTRPNCDTVVPERDCENVQWLLGDWTNPEYGGVIEFHLEADGVAAYVAVASERMEEEGYVRGTQILRGLKFGGANQGTWAFHAEDGESFEAIKPGREPDEILGTAKWTGNALVFIEKAKPGILNLPAQIEGRMSNYHEWVRARAVRPMAQLDDVVGASDRRVRQADASGDSEQRRQVAEELADALESVANDRDAVHAAALIHSLAERERMLSSPRLEQALRMLEQSSDPARESEALATVRAELLERGEHYLRHLANRPMNEKDAANLLLMARQASILRDDLTNPVGAFDDSNSSVATDFLSLADGIAKLQKGAAEGNSSALLDGVQNIARSNPLTKAAGVTRVYDIPAGVATAITDVSRQGFDDSTQALLAVRDAIQGKPGAIQRAIAHSRQVERTLSGQSYADAIAGALTKRVIDRVPVVRSIYAWFTEKS